MRRKSLLFAVAVCYGVIGLMGCSSGPKEKVLLGPKLKPGSAFTYRSAVDLAYRQRFSGNEDTLRWRLRKSATASLIVDEVGPNGSVLVSFRYKHATYDYDSRKETISYDSAAPPAQVPARAADVAALIGRGFSARFDPSSRSIELRGLDKMVQEMIGSLSFSDELEKREVADDIRNGLTADIVKESMTGLFDIFPDTPVAVGDSWKKTVRVASPYAGTSEITYTLVKRKAGLVTLHTKTKTNMLPAEEPYRRGNVVMSFNMTGQDEGTLVVDERTGLPVKRTANGKYSGTCRGSVSDPVKGNVAFTCTQSVRGEVIMELLPLQGEPRQSAK